MNTNAPTPGLWAFAVAACLTLALAARTAPAQLASPDPSTTTALDSPVNPEAVRTPSPPPMTKAGPDEKLADAQAAVAARIAGVRTFKCDVEMRKRRDKPTHYGSIYKIKTGTLELTRGVGGRVVLTRKGETEEYIANQRTIWSYEHKDKEAEFIPTSTPVISTFVTEAMKLNVFFAADPDTIRLRGSQVIDGEDCWVMEGKTPARLKVVGLKQEKMTVWVAKGDGLPRRIHIPGNKFTVSMTNIRVNEDIDPARFEFSPPRGVATKNIFGFKSRS